MRRDDTRHSVETVQPFHKDFARCDTVASVRRVENLIHHNEQRSFLRGQHGFRKFYFGFKGGGNSEFPTRLQRRENTAKRRKRHSRRPGESPTLRGQNRQSDRFTKG